jgi:hypothetical protein
MTEENRSLRVGIAQISPIWLLREPTFDKQIKWIEAAAGEGCGLVVFGEAMSPGYPFWIEHTDGARFESGLQKELYAHYWRQSWKRSVQNVSRWWSVDTSITPGGNQPIQVVPSSGMRAPGES